VRGSKHAKGARIAALEWVPPAFASCLCSFFCGAGSALTVGGLGVTTCQVVPAEGAYLVGCFCGNLAFPNGFAADGRHAPVGTAGAFRFEAGSCVNGVAAPPCASLSGCFCSRGAPGGLFLW
jgi:hypothetical protein